MRKLSFGDALFCALLAAGAGGQQSDPAIVTYLGRDCTHNLRGELRRGPERQRRCLRRQSSEYGGRKSTGAAARPADAA
jgi:hypothetical protein